MISIKPFTTLLILLIFPTLCVAQKSVQTDSSSSPEATVERFFDTLIAGNSKRAFDLLFQGSYLLSKNPQAIAQLQSQVQSFVPTYGSYLGYMKASEKNFGRDLIRTVYILKLEKHPIVWEFYFYRPSSHWLIASVVFEADLEVLR